MRAAMTSPLEHASEIVKRPGARAGRWMLVVATMAVSTLLGPSGCLLSCFGTEAQSFCIETAKVMCQMQYRCCTAVERSLLFGSSNLQLGPYHDEGGCVDVYTQHCEASQQAVDESIGLGRTTFDRDRANECLNARREQVNECDASALYNPADRTCDDIFAGAVADGDACTTGNECAEAGSQCEIDPQQSDDGTITISLEGTCKGQGDEGEDCLPGGVCNGITSGFDDEDDIDFKTAEVATMANSWRWTEQWMPHGAWLFLALASRFKKGEQV